MRCLRNLTALTWPAASRETGAVSVRLVPSTRDLDGARETDGAYVTRRSWENRHGPALA
ncbi:hypothetical protein [Amycolatopsis orientalis]|uniref:hypothetical protein n=1 Tax=Amycolatopsis orientalis TaxID=31958 RepID=UPI00039A3212|nr:hypothetical protein [Amycolatopsis orientalis]